ncbi:hypothetical protein AB0F72_19305 [Actinoplanes sp. NPDC023936]|uniref:hypothetical protein n=1 Tax=Actinoplanes sp. NPDC023936 TaxID=3154910 RepID=UPI0033E6CCA4
MTAGFDELIRVPLPVLAGWLLSADAEPGSLDAQQWRGLTEVFTAELTAEAARVPPPDWPRLSDAYTRLLDRAQQAAALDRHECAVRRLNLTSALLHTVAPDQHVGLLDPAASVHIFFDAVAMSPADAHRLADAPGTLAVNDMRRLRAVKNLLQPLLAVKPLLDAEAARRLTDWERVYPALP